ncbi:MAG: TIGR04282 family arsenosugar biosynthesis glycosyltransferase [Sciscionella sp.]
MSGDGSHTCLLVVAKAPVAGLAKTRLCPPATPEQAAGIAAASLLDTMDTVLGTPDTSTVVAMTGTLDDAACAEEITSALRRAAVIRQRGDGFAERLANAHRDAANIVPGVPLLQIGMDTPQLTAQLLAESAATLHRPGTDAVLGMASDGGWWALGLRDPDYAKVLLDVPMSTSDTGRATCRALLDAGLRVGLLPERSDVDTIADALLVAGEALHGRFARAVAALLPSEEHGAARCH